MLAAAGRCSHPDGDWHNCAYVNARTRLIPAAERAAYEEVGIEPDRGSHPLPRVLEIAKRDHARRWDAAFHRHMERLARERGLVEDWAADDEGE